MNITTRVDNNSNRNYPAILLMLLGIALLLLGVYMAFEIVAFTLDVFREHNVMKNMLSWSEKFITSGTMLTGEFNGQAVRIEVGREFIAFGFLLLVIFFLYVIGSVTYHVINSALTIIKTARILMGKADLDSEG